MFDLAPITGIIESATLRLTVPSQGYVSADATEEFELHEVITDPSTLDVDASGQVAVHDDLANGTLYGSRTYSAADNDTITEIDINAAGIAALNATSGALFAFGGSLSTVVGVAQQVVSANTHQSPYLVELVLQVRNDDDFKCYKAKDLKVAAAFPGVEGVSLVDAFATDPAANVTKLASVCIPVSRDGAELLDPATARCCYKAKTLGAPAPVTATLDDAFGTVGASFQKVQSLCVACTVTPAP